MARALPTLAEDRAVRAGLRRGKFVLDRGEAVSPPPESERAREQRLSIPDPAGMREDFDRENWERVDVAVGLGQRESDLPAPLLPHPDNRRTFFHDRQTVARSYAPFLQVTGTDMDRVPGRPPRRRPPRAGVATVLLLVLSLPRSSCLTATTPARQQHRHTEILLRVYADAEPGDVVYTFDHPPPEGSLRTLRSEESYWNIEDETLLFLADGGRDLVVGDADALAEYVGDTLEFTVVEEDDSSLGNYRAQQLRVRVLGAGERVSFTRPKYSGSVKENLPPGSLVKIDGSENLELCTKYGPIEDGFNNLEFILKPSDPRRNALGPSLTLEELGSVEDSSCLVFVLHTAQMLDREATDSLDLVLQARDESGNVLTQARVFVNVEDENDNLPTFTQDVFELLYDPSSSGRFPTAGRVLALDADGDRVSYSNVNRAPCCLVVPITGEIMVLREDLVANETVLRVGAHERNSPDRKALSDAIVIVRKGKTKDETTNDLGGEFRY